MSGGYFDYAQFKCDEIAHEIERIISTRSSDFTPQTIARFQEAAEALCRAGTMAHRVDWLISFDDSEDDFHRRWDEELEQKEGTK
jgi:hypothetical protein